MIVQWFAEMFYKVITGMLGWINLPNLPGEIYESFGEFIAMIGNNGMALFYFFIPNVLSKVGIPLVLAIMSFKYGYYFVMFILKKIPGFSIS